MRDFTLHNGFVMAFEIAMVVVGIILCIASFSPRPLEQPEYVPNVVAGCATLSGILAAFTGFWLTHIYSNASEQTKKWLSKRIAVVVPLIGFSLTVVLGGLNGLVYDTAEIALRRALFGTDLILLVDFEVSFMTFYRGFGKKDLGS